MRCQPLLVSVAYTHMRFRIALWLGTGGLVATLVFLDGCSTGLGPRTLRQDRPSYNAQIVGTGDEQMLLNLVRLRYRDTPLFLELGSVVAGYTLEGGLNAAGTVVPGPGGLDSVVVGGDIRVIEQPTVTYAPLQGEDFARRILTPVPLEAIMLFAQTGWSLERLLRVVVQRVNDVYNAPTASGPTPTLKPDYERFADLAARLGRLQLAGLVEMNWEAAEGKGAQPVRRARVWLRAPVAPKSPLADDVRAVRGALQLPPDKDEFQLSAYPDKRQPDEVGLRGRSLLGVLFFLSQAVVPPAEHSAAGLITPTKDRQGQPFDWSRVLRRVLRISPQKERPTGAYVSVRHRGWWFFIADNDLDSKTTFALLNYLFSLQSASGTGTSPLLTLPIGR